MSQKVTITVEEYIQMLINEKELKVLKDETIHLLNEKEINKILIKEMEMKNNSLSEVVQQEIKKYAQLEYKKRYLENKLNQLENDKQLNDKEKLETLTEIKTNLKKQPNIFIQQEYLQEYPYNEKKLNFKHSIFSETISKPINIKNTYLFMPIFTKKEISNSLGKVTEPMTDEIYKKVLIFLNEIPKDEKYKITTNKVVKITPLFIFEVQYDLFVEIFKSFIENKKEVVLINKYPSISSKVLFQEYCNQAGIHCLNSTYDEKAKWQRVHIAKFNKCIIALEKQRKKDGLNIFFSFIKHRCPRFQFIGLGKM
ncbi:hypothetical protein ENUP19_0294G0005 [Entamoeba nuttalli]|uniref:Uncharacterized protein n=2 Tax=Entamoeba nuttalli TaxID=412467 RepID=K2H565_ENTNP|nr:hypothetical protein ENU1_192030 [Entamoeba nuttalli P19]EKE37604.1 hypothetical protein ENU1_192030 [Entamoeba nuttalli P19]|eukprot:XP_008860060.1 hypothetical protein ENU1_192030 [Entamoeba nuttalli P19]